jgi:hypothetical protein
MVRSLSPQPQVIEAGWRFTRERRPLPLVKDVRKRVENVLQKLEPALDGRMPSALATQLVRSAEWIGMSQTRENHDDAVADLCTALECMLTTISDGRKGEAIALRLLLLGRRAKGPEYRPDLALYLYKLRSRVLHGADLRCCGERDTRALWTLAVNGLIMALTLAAEHPDVQTAVQFIGLLEDRTAILSALELIKDHPDTESREVASYGYSRIAELVRKKQ